jgi:radical SAM protein with 4Fe4S-binding SPASM domain
METYREVLSLRRKHPNLDVGLETTVSDLNASHLEDYIRLMRRERVDITLSIGHNSYLYQNIQEPDFSPRQHLSALENLVKLLSRSLNPINPKHYIQRVYLKNIPIFFRDPGRLIPCTALKASCALNAQGDIYPCLMWDRPLGNIRSAGYSIEKILADPFTSEVRFAIERKECPFCWTPCEAYQSIFNHLMAPWVKTARVPEVDSGRRPAPVFSPGRVKREKIRTLSGDKNAEPP